MASSGGVEESLDFDFFETPRHQDEDRHPASPASKPPVHPAPSEADGLPSTSSKNKRTVERDGRAKSPSAAKKGSASMSGSYSYSSDSATESEEKHSQSKNKVGSSKEKAKSRRSPSISSLSSTGSNSSASRSRSKRSRSASKSGSNQGSSGRSKSASSLSSDSDEERPSNPIAKGSENSMPKRGRSRLGEDEYSSSAYSEEEGNFSTKSPQESNGEDSKPVHKDPEKRNRTTQKQAWGDKPETDIKADSRRNHKLERVSGKARPKTAKSRTTESTGGNRRRRGDSPGRSNSETLSDSDITDVSPMDSPRLPASTSGSTNKNRVKGKREKDQHLGAAGDGDKNHRYMAMPVNGLDLSEDGGDDSESLKHGHGNRSATNLDLEILMKAVGELEKQKRVQANTRRVMFAPMGGGRDKSNYTFDQNKTRDIERENQRLLNEIVRRVNSTTDQRKQFYASPATSYKLTPSAINRERDMKRIESENMAFLKRLQKVKPTTTICRDHQLREYESTTLHGVPIAALHPLPGRGSRAGAGTGGGRRKSGASSVADTASSIGSRTRSMTSIHSGISSVRSSKRGSRPSSATVRPGSATKRLDTRPGSATKRLDTRPEWSDRW